MKNGMPERDAEHDVLFLVFENGLFLGTLSEVDAADRLVDARLEGAKKKGRRVELKLIRYGKEKNMRTVTFDPDAV